MSSEEEESIEDWVLDRIHSMCEVDRGRATSIEVIVHPKTLQTILAVAHNNIKGGGSVLLSPAIDGYHTIDTPYARVHFEASPYSIAPGKMRRMVSPQRVNVIEDEEIVGPFRPPYERIFTVHSIRKQPVT